jgi:hypothetical protein
VRNVPADGERDLAAAGADLDLLRVPAPVKRFAAGDGTDTVAADDAARVTGARRARRSACAKVARARVLRPRRALP